MGGASKAGWVESASPAWFRSGQLASDWFALGFIQAILNIVPISDLWYSYLLNQIYGSGVFPLPKTRCSVDTHSSDGLKGSLQVPLVSEGSPVDVALFSCSC